MMYKSQFKKKQKPYDWFCGPGTFRSFYANCRSAILFYLYTVIIFINILNLFYI